MFGEPYSENEKWSTEPFGELTNSFNNTRKPVKEGDRRNMQGPYPYYGATGIVDYVNDYKLDGTYLLISEDGKALEFRNYDIAFIATGKIWVNNHAHVVQSKGKVSLEYLQYYFKYLDISDWVSGIDQKKLNRANLDIIPIMVPPEELITQFDEFVRQSDKSKFTGFKSQFIEIFDGKFPLVKTEDVCHFITKGTTPKGDRIIKKHSAGLVPYLKVYNLSFDGSLLFDDEPQYVSQETHNGFLARSKVYPGDVLMNIVGPPLGKFALVTSEYPEWNINQAIAIFRAKEMILPEYLLHALMQPKLIGPFIEKAQGVRQMNFSLEQCRKLEIPLPGLDIQSKFVEFVRQSDKSK